MAAFPLCSAPVSVDGMKPIEEIRKGDWVWSVAPETGDPELLSMEMTIMPITFGKTCRSRKLTEYPTWLPHTEVVINLFMDRKVKMDSVRKLLDKLKNTGKSC